MRYAIEVVIVLALEAVIYSFYDDSVKTEHTMEGAMLIALPILITLAEVVAATRGE